MDLDKPKTRTKTGKPLPRKSPKTTPLPEKPGMIKKAAVPEGIDTKESRGEGDTMKPRHHDIKQPLYQPSLIEEIRKSVKVFGKEAATHRFTLEEKRAIADVVYQYRGQGIKTSENQLARISINFLIEDYRQSGKNSILARVISRLNG